VSRSELIPYIEGEDPRDRHARRLRENLKREGDVRGWARKSGVTMKVHNRGHHWRFMKGSKFAEWWPSTAKLVIQGNYKNERHVHDHFFAIRILERHFKLDKP